MTNPFLVLNPTKTSMQTCPSSVDEGKEDCTFITALFPKFTAYLSIYDDGDNLLSLFYDGNPIVFGKYGTVEELIEFTKSSLCKKET